MTKDYEAKVGDLGISKQLDRSSAANHTKGIGTVGFMAPEVYDAEPYNLKCDIYSLGCVLYFMCMNKPPKKIGEHEPINPAYSSKLKNLVDQMLSKIPS